MSEPEYSESEELEKCAKWAAKEGLPPRRLMSKANSKRREGAIMHRIPTRSLLMTTTITLDWQSRHLVIKLPQST